MHQIFPNHHQLQQPMRLSFSAFSSDLGPDTEIGLFPTALSPPECTVHSSEGTNFNQELILRQDWTWHLYLNFDTVICLVSNLPQIYTELKREVSPALRNQLKNEISE